MSEVMEVRLSCYLVLLKLSYWYRDSHYNDDHLSFIMGIPIPVRQRLFSE